MEWFVPKSYLIVPLVIFFPIMDLSGAQSLLWLNTQLLLSGEMARAEEGHTEEQCEGSWHTMTLWLMQASLGSQQARIP